MNCDFKVGELVRVTTRPRGKDDWSDLYTSPGGESKRVKLNLGHDAIIMQLVPKKFPDRWIAQLLFPTGIGWVNTSSLERV